MKKLIIYFSGILIASTLFLGCNKSFLNEELKSTYAPQNTLKDSLGFDAAITGLTFQFRQQWTGEPQGLICVMNVGTDLAISTQPEGSEVPYTNYAALNSQDKAAGIYWSWAYTVVNNANFIINALHDPANQVGMTATYRNMIEGEARFYRAWAYNFLSILYGGVPLIDKPITAPKTDFVRATQTDVINFIITDLLFSTTNCRDIDYISNVIKREGRVCKSAAQQLLAEVYIRAGKSDLAEAQCKNIINSGFFQLTTTRYGVNSTKPGDPFSDMFITGNQRRRQGNKEALWVIEQEYNVPGGAAFQPGNTTPSDQHRRVWVARYVDISGVDISDSLGGRGIARMRLSNWAAYGLYKPNDMRNSRFNIRRNFWYSSGPKIGQKVVPNPADTLFKLCPYTTKWNNYVPADAFGYADYKDIIMMRLGETYLLMAEAQFNQNHLTDAAATLNTLRARSNATPILPTDVTLDFILDERARELMAEENRRMTLVRTGKLIDRTLALNSSFQGQGAGIKPYNMLMPIPQSEIDLNKNATLTQNPNY
jgi:starch-binding outer membrane protein, SusD/RagB family